MIPLCVVVMAAPLFAGCSGDVVVRTPPPAERVEVVPRARPGFVWVRGHWRWNGHEYVWVAGHWDTVRAGHVWVEGHWDKRPGGWVWVEGYWR
ncbi:MAG TPA: YXWGXW repeat-containing protein [Minicystis sp.]|nr:YXWGXW repeat-containing protein [Minicystis sp.]